MRILYSILLLFSFESYAQVWSPLDKGLTGQKGASKVRELMIYNGRLYVSGNFFNINNTNIGAMARWDGAGWDSVGCPRGFMGSSDVMRIYNDKLHVGGYIDDVCEIINQPGANNLMVATWNDSIWDEIGYWKGTLENSGEIYSMAVYKGELYVGGNILAIKGVTTKGIARWDGSKWRSVRSGVTGGWRDVSAMAVYKDELYIGGSFTGIDSQLCLGVAKWNGSTWSPVGTGLAAGSGGGGVGGMVVDTVKNVLYLVGGFQYAGGIKVGGIAQWDGTKWDSVGTPINNGGQGICMYRNKLFIGGSGKTYTPTDTVFASWDGKKWTPHLGPDGTVKRLIQYQDKLIVGGYFNQVGTDTLCKGIASYYEPPVGIHQTKEKKDNVVLYPNPANTLVHIKINNEKLKQVFIYNTLGELVFQQTENALNNPIDISHLPKGIYTVKIIADYTYHKKLLIK